MPIKASEKQLVVEVDEGTAAPNPPITSEDPISEPSSRVVVFQPLINLEEELVATNIEEEPETAVDPTVV